MQSLSNCLGDGYIFFTSLGAFWWYALRHYIKNMGLPYFAYVTQVYCSNLIQPHPDRKRQDCQQPFQLLSKCIENGFILFRSLITSWEYSVEEYFQSMSLSYLTYLFQVYHSILILAEKDNIVNIFFSFHQNFLGIGISFSKHLGHF